MKFFRRLSRFLLGIALGVAGPVAPAQEHYVLVDRPSSTIRVFRLADHEPVSEIRTGTAPQSFVISPDGRLAYVANLNQNYLSVVDLGIQSEVRRLHGVRARDIALNADGSKAVATLLTDAVAVIETATYDVTTVSVDGLLGDTAGTNNASLSSVIVVGNQAYVNAFGAGIGVINLDTLSVTAVPDTNGSTDGGGHNFLAVSPDGSRVLALRSTNSNTGRLLAISTTSNTIIQSADLPSAGFGLAVRDLGPGLRAYVIRRPAFGAAALIQMFDLSTGAGFGTAVGSTATLPYTGDLAVTSTANIFGLAFSDDGIQLAVTCGNANAEANFAIVDTASMAVVHSRRIASRVRDVTIAHTQVTQRPDAPTVTAVIDPDDGDAAVVNDESNTITILGSGFSPDVVVRLGNLEPIAPVSVTAESLQVLIPQGKPAQNADIIVTRANLEGALADRHVSGILRAGLVIASPSTFLPAHQVVVSNFGESTLSILNASTNATVAPSLPAPDEPMGVAISDDGEIAYTQGFFTATVHGMNLRTRELEGTPFPTSFPPASSGQLSGIVFARTPAGARVLSADCLNTPAGWARLRIFDAEKDSPSRHSLLDTINLRPSGRYLCGALATNPAGTHAYAWVFNAGADHWLISVDLATGTVSSRSGGTMAANTFQFFLEVTSDSLVLSGFDPNTILVFDLDDVMSGGAPRIVVPTPPTGGTVRTVAYEVLGDRLFAFDPLRNLVFAFDRDPETGDFTQVGSAQIPGTPGLFGAGMAVTRDGSLVYAALREDDAVAVVATDRLTSAHPAPVLTQIRTGLAPSTLAIRPGTPVAAGVEQKVSPIVEAEITFTNVLVPGSTSITTTNAAPGVLPTGFQLGTIPIYYEISTTAIFSGPIEVCFAYDPALFEGPESELRFLHQESGAFVDRTTSLDIGANRICGLVDSFSLFTVGLGSRSFLFDLLVSAIESSGIQTGIRRSLMAKALNARVADERGQPATALHQLQALQAELAALTEKQIAGAQASYLGSVVGSLIVRY